MRLFLLVSLSIFIASSVFADCLDFKGMRFGDSPQEEMICIKGNCPERFQQLSRKTDFPHSTYIFDEDITHIRNVPIEPPEYDFFEGQLYRIKLTLKCDKAFGDQCINSALNEIKSEHGYTVISTDEFDDSPRGTWYFERGETYLGDEVVLNWTPEFPHQRYPHIDIQNIELLETVRLAANPNYVSKRK